MELQRIIRTARGGAGMTLRGLSASAGTSHATIAAYEAGRTSPSIDTLERIVRAAGFDVEAQLVRRVREADGLARGDELVEVLHLAEQFPAHHERELTAPPFGRVSADA